MTPKKEKSLVEITEEEFIKLITDNIDTMQDNIYELQNTQEKFYRLYRNYNVDKNKYNLKFFIKDTVITYQKFHKPKIGFRKNYD